MSSSSTTLDPVTVQAALLAHPAVADCFVLPRADGEGAPSLTGWVVPVGAFAPDRLKAHVSSVLAVHDLTLCLTPISNIPLTDAGQVDEAALAAIPVLEPKVLDEWRDAVAAVADTAAPVVDIRELVSAPGRLHLADLLPAGWSSTPDLEDAIVSGRARTVRTTDVAAAPSISEGPPIDPGPGVATLPEALRRAALMSPDKGVVAVRPDDSDVFMSYPALLETAERVLGGLRGLGLKPADKVIFQLDRPDEFIPAFWGCVLGGFVPVPVSMAPSYREANSTVAKLQNAWAMLDRPVVLTRQDLLADVRGLSAVVDMPGLQVASVADLLQAPRDQRWHEGAPEDLALLLLTSGSTGRPKAVAQSHRALLARSAANVQMHGFTREDVFLNWLPLDHVGGIVMFHLHDVCLGCRQVHGPTSTVLQDPLKWLDWIERYRVTGTWAPNFAFGLVNAQAEEIGRRRWDLSTLRFILNAGEAIVARTARRFLELLAPHGLPGTAMYPAWGMSETCSAVTYLLDFSLATTSDQDLFVEVGGCIPGFAMRIVDAADQPIPEMTIGRLQVKGPSVTTGYYQNESANRESFTADGWFKTGDLGRICNGRLTITGREKDVIIVNGANYYSHEIEKVVEDTPGVEVSFTAAFAVREAGSDTDRLAICFSPSESAAASDGALAALVRDVRQRVVQDVGINPTHLVPVDREVIPKTAIGKIQRAELARRLQGGDFDSILRRVDLLLENARTIPDCFYRRVWRPRQIAATVAPAGRWLAFVDDRGVASRTLELVAGIEPERVTVTRGQTFAKLGPRSYTVAPSDPGSYKALIDALTSDGFQPTTILHCWAIDEPAGLADPAEFLAQGQDDGLFSVLALTQALASHDRPMRLVVATRRSQVVAAGDDAGPNATLPGLLKTIAQELPATTCRHVDFAPAASAEEMAGALVEELGAVDGECEVAYRDGTRYVSRLQHLDLAAAPKQPLPFKRGGFYVVSGGLGAIGSEVARQLIDHFDARLLLIGRSAIAADGEDSERAQRLRDLAPRGHVVYEAVDVRQYDRVHEAVECAGRRWGLQLDGVVHLAGEFEERLLADESRQHVTEVLGAKVDGTLALRRLLADRPGAVFVAFSSVNGFFGGFSSASYSAANAYLDASVEAMRLRGMQAASLAWSLWDEFGMSRGYRLKDLSRARGYLPIGKTQGLQAWRAVLHAGGGHVLIGLDGRAANVRRFVDGPVRPLQQVCITSEGPAARVADRLKTVEIRDRFGRRVSAQVGQAAEAASAQARQTGGVRADEPRTELQRLVAQIWQEVLDADALDLDKNFFDLGATSLLIAQAYRRISAGIEGSLAMTDLFRYPTVRALCQHLERRGSAVEDHPKADAERGTRRRAQAMRRRERPSPAPGVEEARGPAR